MPLELDEKKYSLALPGTGNDSIFGNASANWLEGADGNDSLVGGLEIGRAHV